MASDDKTVGRTPWDVASEVLTRLGPTAIIVAGFLAFTGFLYLEVRKEGKDENRELTKSLKETQNQIIENTKKMGEMSEKMIANINEILELRNTVDKNSQVQREKFENELNELQNNIRTAKQDHGNLLTSIEEKQSDLEVKERRLKEREAILGQQEEKVNSLNNTIAAMSKVIDQHAEQIAKLKSSGGNAERPTTGSNVSEEETIRTILAGYAEKPEDENKQKSLQELVGLKVSVLEDVVKKDGLEFSTWFRDPTSKIFGYLEQTTVGPRNYVRIMNNGRTITRVDAVLANVFVRIPKAQNWYETWLCDVVVTKDKLRTSYSTNDRQEWTQIGLYAGRRTSRTKVESIVYTNKLKPFKVATIVELQKLFSNQFEDWKSSSDFFGRPGLILKMIDRSANFDATKLVGVQSSALPDKLQPTIARLMNAAVSRDYENVKRHLDTNRITLKSFGELAAIALREPRIENVVDRSFTDRGNNKVSRWIVTFRYEALRSTSRSGPGKATITFSETSGAWTLVGLKSQN